MASEVVPARPDGCATIVRLADRPAGRAPAPSRAIQLAASGAMLARTRPDLMTATTPTGRLQGLGPLPTMR